MSDTHKYLERSTNAGRSDPAIRAKIRAADLATELRFAGAALASLTKLLLEPNLLVIETAAGVTWRPRRVRDRVRRGRGVEVGP